MKKSIRERIYQWLTKKARVPEGACRPTWLLVVRGIFWPIQSLWTLILPKIGPIRYDWYTNTFTLWGHKVTKEWLVDNVVPSVV